MYHLPEDAWPSERKWKATGRARGRYVGDLERAVYESFGDEGLKVIGQVYAQAAERTFLQGLKNFGIKEKDARAFALFFVISNTIIGYDMELVEATPERAVVRYHTCHLFDASSSGNARICREANFNFERRAAQLLNPKLKVTMTKLRAAGDPCCEFIVEMTSSDTK